jgi:hypothetical protein
MGISHSVAIGLVFIPALAMADTRVATADQAPAAAPPTTVTAPATTAAPAPSSDDGVHFRNGFSLSAGEEFGSGPSSGLSGQLFGADWRIGARIAGDWAVYADTHLSLGTAKIGGTGGVTGNFAIAALGERALPGRTFVAAGGGYGVLNNPSGPLVQARAGWYIFQHDAPTVSRRLNVAIDARWYFAGGDVGTVTQIALTLGYDRF